MTLSQDIQLRILAAVEGVERITSLGGALNTVKAAAAGLAGALFVQELGEMVMEADKANKNVAMFSRTMKAAGLDADEARKKVDEFAVTTGVSRNEMQAHIAQLVNSGLGLQESVALTSAAFDTATAAGKSTEQAMNSLTSAMITGSSEYLNTLGITQNFDQTYKEFAVSIGKTVTALSEEEKMQARVNHVMKYASQDLGAHAAQMDGLTGMVSRYESTMRSVRREVGEKFIPVWEAVYKILLTNITGFEKWLKSTDAVEKVARFLKTSIEGAARVMEYLRSRAVELRPALDSMAKAGDNVVRFVTSFVTKVGNGADGADLLRQAVDLVVEVVNKLAKGAEFVSQHLDVLVVALGAGAVAWAVMGGAAATASAALGAVTVVLGVLTSPVTLVIAAVAALGLAWKSNFLGIRDYTAAAWRDIQKWWDQLKVVFGAVWDWLKERLPRAWETFKKMFGFAVADSPVYQALKVIPGLFDQITDRMLNVWNKAKEFWGWLKGETARASQELQTQVNPDANGSAPGGGKIGGADKLADLITYGRSTRTQDYGVNANKYGYGPGGHNGIDYRVGNRGANANDKLRMAFTGNVKLFENDKWLGNYVEVTDALGQKLILGHLRAFDKALLESFKKNGSKAMRVEAGTFLGYEGNTGNSFGAHLHLGAKDRFGRTVNPNTITYQALGTPGGASGSGTATGGGANPQQAAAQEKAKQDAILKVAKEYAQKIDDIDAKLAKTKDSRVRETLFNQRAALVEETNKWIGSDKEKREAFNVTMRQRQKARELEAQQTAAAEEAQRKAEKENAVLAQKKWEYQKAVSEAVLKSYQLEVDAAQGNKTKLLAIENAWGKKVLEARRKQATAEAEIEKARLRDDFKKATRDDKGNLTVSAGTESSLKVQLDKDLALVDRNLTTTLQSLSNKAKTTATQLTREAAEEARENARTVFGAVSSARQAVLQNRVNDAQAAYEKEMRLAEGNSAKMVAVEEKQGRALLIARNKLIEQQTQDSIKAADHTYNENKLRLEKTGGDVAALTRAWKEQTAAIRSAGDTEKQGNRDEATQALKDARLGLSRFRREMDVQDAENALSSLENQLAAGQVAWEKAEQQRLRLTEVRINAQRQLDIAGASGNADVIKRINAKADGDIKAARLASTKEIQDRQIAAAGIVADAAQMQLENQLGKGSITRAEYEEKNLQITLKNLAAGRDAELRDTSLSEAQREAIREKYRQLGFKAQIEANQRKVAALERAAQAEENLELLSLKNRFDGRMMTEQEYDGAVRQISEKRLARERDRALKENQDGAAGAERIWRGYYLSLDTLAEDQRKKDHARAVALQQQVDEVNRTGLENQIKAGKISNEQRDKALLQMQLDALDRQYQNEVDWGNRTAAELKVIWQKLLADKEALNLDSLERQRQHALDIEGKRASAGDQVYANSLERGTIGINEYERLSDQSALNAADRERRAVTETPGVNPDAAEAAWTAYWAKADAISLAATKRIADRDLALQKAGLQTYLDALDNSLQNGSMSWETYQDERLQTQKDTLDLEMAAELSVKTLTAEQRSAIEKRYEQAGIKLTQDSEKAKADARRAAALQSKQNAITALENQLQAGKITREKYDADRLKADQDVLKIQQEAELSTTNLTKEQRLAIQKKYELLGVKLVQDSEQAKKDIVLKGQAELREAALASQEREFRTGKISLDKFLTDRAATQEAAAVAQHEADKKAAQGNVDLILAADQRLAETRQKNADEALKIRTDTELSKAKEENDLALALLEEQHAAKLISESAYLKEKAALTVKNLRAEQKAAEALEPDPAKKAAITARYTAAISAVTNQATRDIKEVNKALREQTDSLSRAAEGWLGLIPKLRELDKQIEEINKKLGQGGITATEKSQLTMQKNMLTVSKYAAVAETAVSMLADGLEFLGGMSGEMAQQWAADMGSMVNDVTNFAMAIAKGDYFSAAIQVLTTIWNWFTRNARAAKEAAEATKKYNEQFRFNKDGYGTRKVETYTTGFLFWQTTHYKESVDEASKALALSFEGAVADGVSSGLSRAAETGDSTEITKAIYTGLKDAAFKGLTEAFLNSGSVAAVVGPLIQKLIAAFKTGNKDTIAQALSEFKTGVQALKPEIDALVAAGQMVNDVLGETAGIPASLAKSIREEGEALDSLYARGLISRRDYEKQKLALALKRMNAEMQAELSKAGLTAQEIQKIKDKYAGEEVKLRMTFDPDSVTPTVIQLADRLADAIQNGISSGAKKGIKDAILSGSTEGLGRAIREEVGSNILDAMIDAFLKSAAMKAIIEPAMQQLADALADSDPSNDDSAFAAFDSALSKYTAAAEKFAGRLSKTFGRGGLMGPGATDGTITNKSKDTDKISTGSVAYQMNSSSSGGFQSVENMNAVVTALNSLPQVATLMMDAAKINLQAANINLQAAGAGFAAKSIPVGRLEFGQEMYENARRVAGAIGGKHA